MDDLLDLLFDLLGWALPLIGKFWFLILGYLGYILFGKQTKKPQRGRPARRPVLTPVESGGWPWEQEQEERRTVTPLENRKVMSPEKDIYAEDWQEVAADAQPLPTYEEEPSVEVEKPSVAAAATKTPNAEKQHQNHLDAREGMKWAIIYGAPRARTSPLPSRRGF
ncbi:hypothetical protein NDK47_17065 [Brevibacillus ruminantium]|uniref:Uncharacterized protein n=1 Tax=Brevibacillus ruminantium TaxID=2950604 RepID=A0ABY4WCG8_9BACL|nr:hypothetical protein [Brevibacillus ruminantium]USG63863.1 hypothetical protein NDK47_17065 [Brevibacillus ruminantium]